MGCRQPLVRVGVRLSGRTEPAYSARLHVVQRRPHSGPSPRRPGDPVLGPRAARRSALRGVRRRRSLSLLRYRAGRRRTRLLELARLGRADERARRVLHVASLDCAASAQSCAGVQRPRHDVGDVRRRLSARCARHAGSARHRATAHAQGHEQRDHRDARRNDPEQPFFAVVARRQSRIPARPHAHGRLDRDVDVRRREAGGPPQRDRVATVAHARISERQGHAGGRRGRVLHRQPAQSRRPAGARRRPAVRNRVDLRELPPVGPLAHAPDLEPRGHALQPRHRRDPGRPRYRF